MKRAFCLIATLALTACGVDGEPEQPVYTDVGIAIGSGGHVGGSIGVSRGPLSVGVGIF
ncbi:hypothetical protein [Tateyamaria sp. Alg231-49]|uniref:hypothetical protein n=1 Tax=Tateyamaria sp. Alg231-49 TaxID=1922219 RepID=UPI00190160DF|nr:hypothetical protein [Tateyamaria sp. Alg231-49]